MMYEEQMADKMVDYYDIGSNIQELVNTLYDEPSGLPNKDSGKAPWRSKGPIDKTFFEVRKSVCVAGYHGDSLQDVKRRIADLMDDEACPIESFHVRGDCDLRDGVFLVPKIVLVGFHTPGRKLLDDEADTGQLDLLYDEACEVGADIMVVYVGLPRAIYEPMKHVIYHPKMEEMVFPTQPLLRQLATENAFITVCEGCNFTAMQKNLLREWLEREVDTNHPVYTTANRLCATENTNEELPPQIPPKPIDNKNKEKDFQPAEESHPLADKKKKKKSKKRSFGFSSLRRKDISPGYAQMDDLDPVHEDKEEWTGSIEMNMYKSTEQETDMQGSSPSVF